MSATLPNFTLSLQAPTTGRYCNDKGWYWWDPAKNLMASDYFVYPWNLTDGWGASGLPADMGKMASMMYVDPLQACICRPYYRYDYIPMSALNLSGSANWAEEDSWSPGNSVGWHMFDADQAGTTGFTTTFSLPINASFGFKLGRFAPTEAQPFGSTEPYTSIVYGGIMVTIPFWRAAQVWIGNSTFGFKLVGELDLRLSSTDSYQEVTIGVLSVGGRLLFTTDHMQSFQVFQLGDRYPDDWLTFPAGPLTVEHYGSRWIFALYPIDFPLPGKALSRAVDRGYDPVNPVQGDQYGLLTGADGQAWTINGQQAAGINITPAESGRSAQYLVAMTPYTYTIALGGGNTAKFGITPEIYATRIHCPPSVATRTVTATTDVIQPGDILQIEVEYPEAIDVSNCKVTLDNSQQLPTNYNGLQGYGVIDIDAAPLDGGASVHLFDGYIYDPQAEVNERAYTVTFECVDLWQKLRDIFCTEADPCFAGWPVARAIWWMCAKSGIDFDWPSYDSGTRLDRDLYKALWQPQTGVSAADFIKELAAYERYNFWFDGATAKYQPFPSDSVIDHHFSFHSTPGDDGAPATAQKILRQVKSNRDPTRHRNVVRIVGQDANGNRLVAVKKKVGNINTQVGWERELVEINPDYNTQARVNYVCYKAFDEASIFPPWDLDFSVRFNPNIKRWQHCKIWGTGVGINKGVFRIVNVKHLIAKEGAGSTTTVRARYRRSDS